MESARVLIDDINQYLGRFPFEHKIVEEFISLLLRDTPGSSPSPFDREYLNPGHITASAWIIDPNRSKVVLLNHKKLCRWLQPGGHADGDRNCLRVALREASEETGICGINAPSAQIFDLDIHSIPPRQDIPAHKHFDIRYLFLADSTSPIFCSNESLEVRWVPFSELASFSNEPSLLRMLHKFTALRLNTSNDKVS